MVTVGQGDKGNSKGGRVVRVSRMYFTEHVDGTLLNSIQIFRNVTVVPPIRHVYDTLCLKEFAVASHGFHARRVHGGMDYRENSRAILPFVPASWVYLWGLVRLFWQCDAEHIHAPDQCR